MEFFSSFKMVGSAVLQLVILGACGFVLVKKNILPEQTLQVLSKILMNLFFPCFIFNELINNFKISQFKSFWIYPFFSALIIGVSFVSAYIALPKKSDFKDKREFLAAITFSNAGYLPLVLIAALFSGTKASQLFIYLFLFLLGFNVIIWSFGVSLLVSNKKNFSNLSQFFSAPVIAILLGLVVAFLKAGVFIPTPIFKSINMLGACTLPLAMIVTGANLSLIKIQNIFGNKQLQTVILMKLILVPALAFFLLLVLKIDPLAKFIFLLQAAMPTAVSLSVICRTFDLKGELANQAIFWTHIFLIITLPFFLIIFKIIADLA
ncbi:MAG: AEC family transporter [Candidatus Omnitrophota bacterium]